MAQGQRRTSNRHDAPINGGGRHRDSQRPKKPFKASEKQGSKLFLEVRPDWHAASLPEITVPAQLSPVPAPLLEKLHQHAKSLLDTENTTYTATHSQASSSYKFMSTIMASGTWSDKVSALTLVVQESPLHTMKPFENLINLAAKRSRSQALMALGALKDLLSQGVVLPTDRKLRVFNKQPELLAALQGVRPTWSPSDQLPNGLEEAHLISWAFEDWLKKQYFEMLKTIETWCNDEVEFARIRAVTFVWELLKEKPEQEENLLRLLVNKLGDTSRKVASRASYLLLQLQSSHPSMKSVIVSAIEADILMRPGQSSNSKYYAIITLNQTVLQTSDPDVANKLLDVYFSLFVAFLNRSKHGKVSNFDIEDKSANGEQSKKRKRPSATTDMNKAEQEIEDKIIAQVLTGVNRAFPFAKKDHVVFEKHLDTMFRITHSSNFNTSVQALMLIQQISTSQHLATDRFLRTLYESLLDPRLIKSSKQTMYLNLLYRSLKSDISIRRVKAFVKRLLQIITLHEPPFACAVLYLIVELQSAFPSVKAMLDQPETMDEDGEEVFADVPDEDDAVVNNGTKSGPTLNGSLSEVTPKHIESTSYDGRKRDPEHSNADRTCLWELPPWLNHYHPSLQLFARYLLSPTTTSAPPKPDPTTHTLIHFLDRFAYRNPKARSTSSSTTATIRGSSIMQPALASTNTTDSFLTAGDRAQAPLNSEAFWKRKVEDVKADEVFFHRYFGVIGEKKFGGSKAEKERKKKEKEAEDDDAASDDDYGDKAVGGEEEIWKALVGSAPELDAGSDVDIDDDEGFDDEDVDIQMSDDDDDEGVPDDDDDGGVDIEDGLDLDDLLAGEADDDNADVDDDDDDDAFNLEGDEGSDIFGSDEDAPDAPEEVVAPKKGGKVKMTKEERKAERNEKKAKRRRLRDLPVFADADEYARMIGEGGGEEDEGVDMDG